MAKTGLRNGPFKRSDIDTEVESGRSTGVYALGYLDPDDGKFVVKYVGRSDHNDDGLNGRLHDHDDDSSKKKCTHFKFDYAKDAKEAFEWESRIYHDFEPSLNDAHPARPKGTNYKCPVGGDGCFE